MKSRGINTGGREINGLDPYTLCHTCLGCNQLSMSKFRGEYECEYYAKGVYANNEHRKEVRATNKR